MNVVIIIFMIVSTVFALATLGYVIVDFILENRNGKKPKEENKEELAPESEELKAEIEPEPEIIESEPVIIPENMPEPVSADFGIEVIDVAWPESMAKNKIYKYDPNGETVSRGDTVLVPTVDKHRHGAILRTATVINGNYRVEEIPSDKVLKKIIRVIK